MTACIGPGSRTDASSRVSLSLIELLQRHMLSGCVNILLLVCPPLPHLIGPTVK